MYQYMSTHRYVSGGQPLLHIPFILRSTLIKESPWEILPAQEDILGNHSAQEGIRHFKFNVNDSQHSSMSLNDLQAYQEYLRRFSESSLQAVKI